MLGYVCFWNNKRVEVYANTTFEAQQKAMPLFQKLAGRRKVKSYDITVVLAEKDGKPVTHLPLD